MALFAAAAAATEMLKRSAGRFRNLLLGTALGGFLLVRASDLQVRCEESVAVTALSASHALPINEVNVFSSNFCPSANFCTCDIL